MQWIDAEIIWHNSDEYKIEKAEEEGNDPKGKGDDGKGMDDGKTTRRL